MSYKIALDGPSGAGKSTLAKLIAKELGIVYVDTGAMYRTIGLYVRQHGILPEDKEKICSLLPDIRLDIAFTDGKQQIFLCGKAIGDEIRTPEISTYASKVSAIPEVRAFLLDTQRSLAATHSVIMDGRDIGTVIFPDAEVKIFLTASEEARARRRTAELAEKGIAADYETVLRDMKERDRADRERTVAPAVAAADAVLLDNSDLDLDGTVKEALRLIRNKIGTTPA